MNVLPHTSLFLSNQEFVKKERQALLAKLKGEVQDREVLPLDTTYEERKAMNATQVYEDGYRKGFSQALSDILKLLETLE